MAPGGLSRNGNEGGGAAHRRRKKTTDVFTAEVRGLKVRGRAHNPNCEIGAQETKTENSVKGAPIGEKGVEPA